MPQTAENTLKVQHDPDAIGIYFENDPRPLLVQNAEPNKRPFLHPLRCPVTGSILTEDAPPHHPWQHGLYFGLNDVNGVGFWTEHLSEKRMATDGYFDPAPLAVPKVEDRRASWQVETTYRCPKQEAMMIETQEWCLQIQDHDRLYVLDLEWSLKAQQDLTFGQYAYGGLFLRMPYRKETGGTARNSEGLKNPECEGQRARWVAVSMLLVNQDDQTNSQENGSMAILDHPENPEHPVPWRVDGQLGIGPGRCIAGAWNLPKNESTTSRYRMLMYPGAIDSDLINAQWDAFSKDH